jgi:hypothetical protein
MTQFTSDVPDDHLQGLLADFSCFLDYCCPGFEPSSFINDDIETRELKSRAAIVEYSYLRWTSDSGASAG